MTKQKETFEVWRTPKQRRKPSTRANLLESGPFVTKDRVGSQKRKKNSVPSPRGMKTTVLNAPERQREIQEDESSVPKKRAKGDIRQVRNLNPRVLEGEYAIRTARLSVEEDRVGTQGVLEDDSSPQTHPSAGNP